eukprot:8148579-Pyramimonas_sp.AAC.1
MDIDAGEGAGGRAAGAAESAGGTATSAAAAETFGGEAASAATAQAADATAENAAGTAAGVAEVKGVDLTTPPKKKHDLSMKIMRRDGGFEDTCHLGGNEFGR